MNISFRITIVLIMLFAIIAPRCHGAQLLDDFAGLRKSTNTGPIWAPDPSRLFATPGGGGHPEGASAVSRSTASRSDTSSDKPAADTSSNKPSSDISSKPTVKPESKPEDKPDIPTVKPPKDEPVKPECKPKPHKCWPFKFRAPKAKPECKPDAKHDKKPSCKPEHKSKCSKPGHQGHRASNQGRDSFCGKFGGQKGPVGTGLGMGFGHSKGIGRKGGHGHGNGHGKGGR